ncbi:hypothetical protein Bca4012_100658 [Brassica carinata]
MTKEWQGSGSADDLHWEILQILVKSTILAASKRVDTRVYCSLKSIPKNKQRSAAPARVHQGDWVYLGRGCKGQGRTLQTKLISKTMGVEPVIMSAGELKSVIAGDFLQPGYLQTCSD